MKMERKAKKAKRKERRNRGLGKRPQRAELVEKIIDLTEAPESNPAGVPYDDKNKDGEWVASDAQRPLPKIMMAIKKGIMTTEPGMKVEAGMKMKPGKMNLKPPLLLRPLHLLLHPQKPLQPKPLRPRQHHPRPDHQRLPFQQKHL